MLRARSEAIEALNAQQALDLASMQRLQQISAQLLQENELDDLLGKIMDAAIDVTGADKGTLQLMRSGELRIAHQRCQATQLTRLVDDLLDVSRITQGRIQLKRRPIELATVIVQAIETVETQWREKQHCGARQNGPYRARQK